MDDVLEKSYRRKTVQAMFDLKTSTLYDQLERGIFPPPDYYLGKMPFWRHSTLERHQRELMAANRPRAKARTRGGA